MLSQNTQADCVEDSSGRHQDLDKSVNFSMKITDIKLATTELCSHLREKRDISLNPLSSANKLWLGEQLLKKKVVAANVSKKLNIPVRTRYDYSQKYQTGCKYIGTVGRPKFFEAEDAKEYTLFLSRDRYYRTKSVFARTSSPTPV